MWEDEGGGIKGNLVFKKNIKGILGVLVKISLNKI